MKETPPITFHSLLRKYGGNIARAHALEIRAAAQAVPLGKNKWEHLDEEVRAYTEEVVRKAAKQRRTLCFNKEGLCGDDRCYCTL